MNENRRPWAQNKPKSIEPHVISKGEFEQLVKEHKNKMRSYRQQIAYYVVILGHEPKCWNETWEITLDLVARTKRRKRGNNA